MPMLIQTSQLNTVSKASTAARTAAPSIIAEAVANLESAQPADTAALSSETEVKPELSTGEKMKKWFFDVRRKDGKLVGAPFHKMTYGAVLLAGAVTAGKVAMDIAGGGSIAAVAGKVALDGAALVGGYLAADVASGVLHHWADNYASPDSTNQLTRKFAKQAQRHHFHPTKLGNYTPSYWANPLALVAWAPLVGATALGAPGPVLSGLLGLVGGMIHYGNFHNWSHMKSEDVPAVGKFLQKAGLAISREDHLDHHNVPWNNDYCIVNGKMNAPLDAIKFWPRYEKAVHAITGAEPESWKMPEYKAYVDGELTREEYIGKRKEEARNFVRTELPARKQKWGID